MAEIEWDTDPKRPSLLRAIRHQTRNFERPCRIVAENFLATESRIDLLGVGNEGELVSLRIGGQGEDARLLTRSLSDLVWLDRRAADLRKLAPELGIESGRNARAILLCPEFQQDTCAAVRFLPGDAIELIQYRGYRIRGQLEVVLEMPSSKQWPASEFEDAAVLSDRQRPGIRGKSPNGSRHSKPTSSPICEPTLDRHGARGDQVAPTGFRTGLTDAQLRVDRGLP